MVIYIKSYSSIMIVQVQACPKQILEERNEKEHYKYKRKPFKPTSTDISHPQISRLSIP